MSALAATLDATTAPLARSLLRRAHAVLPRLAPSDPARTESLAAIDAFAAAPATATFLAAAHALARALRGHLVTAVVGQTRRRAFEAGLEALRTVAVLPEPVVGELAAHLPVDARAGERLEALAALLSSWEALAGRAAADAQALRARFRPARSRGRARRR